MLYTSLSDRQISAALRLGLRFEKTSGFMPNGTHFVSGKALAAGIPTAYSL